METRKQLDCVLVRSYRLSTSNEMVQESGRFSYTGGRLSVISTLAGYVELMLDRVTENFVDLRAQFRPAPRIVLQDRGSGSWNPDGQDGRSGTPWPPNAEVTLILDSSRFLVLSMPLPIGAKPYLKGVIASQIDRISPWTSERAIFGAAIAQETTSGLTVRIAIAARDTIEERIRSLGHKNIRSLTLRVPTDRDGLAIPIEIPFKTGTRSGRPPERQVIAGVFFGVIAFVCIVQLARIMIGSSTEDALTNVRGEIASFRDTIAGARYGRDIKIDPLARMVNAKISTPPAVEMLDALADVTPDHTYLTAFEVEPDKIHIEGISTTVTDLPKAIGGNSLFGEVSFSAPTAKRRDGVGETFQIDIMIKPRQGTEP